MRTTIGVGESLVWARWSPVAAGKSATTCEGGQLDRIDTLVGCVTGQSCDEFELAVSVNMLCATAFLHAARVRWTKLTRMSAKHRAPRGWVRQRLSSGGHVRIDPIAVQSRSAKAVAPKLAGVLPSATTRSDWVSGRLKPSAPMSLSASSDLKSRGQE